MYQSQVQPATKTIFKKAHQHCLRAGLYPKYLLREYDQRLRYPRRDFNYSRFDDIMFGLLKKNDLQVYPIPISSLGKSIYSFSVMHCRVQQ